MTAEEAVNAFMQASIEPAMYDLNDRVRAVLESARIAIASYVPKKAPNRADQSEAARHAIRLGKLDSMQRATRLDPTFEETADEDVEDLLAMLAVVPFESLMHDKVLLLNPTFGQAGRLVGGARHRPHHRRHAG